MGVENTAERPKKRGRLTAVFGPMFSGKTDYLIDEIDKHAHAHRIGIMVKPSNDTRFGAEDEVVAHSGKRINATRVDANNPMQILDVLRAKQNGHQIRFVAIDEAQFFEAEGLLRVVDEILSQGVDVTVGGLAADSADEPFGAMPTLVIQADEPVHRTAFCTYILQEGETEDDDIICGEVATKTQRRVQEGGQILVGAEELFAASCRDHHKRHEDWPVRKATGGSVKISSDGQNSSTN